MSVFKRKGEVRKILKHLIHVINELEMFTKGMTEQEFINDRHFELSFIPKFLEEIGLLIDKVHREEPRYFNPLFVKELEPFQKQQVTDPVAPISEFRFYTKISQAIRMRLAEICAESIWKACTSRLTSLRALIERIILDF